MISQFISCPICKTSLDNKASKLNGNIFSINCRNCKNYQFSKEFYEDNLERQSFNDSQLATLSYAIQRMQRNGLTPCIDEELASNILQSTILPTATEQLDNLVLFLGQTLTEPGQKLQLDTDTLRATLGSITEGATGWVIEQAIERGLMQG